MDIEKLKSPMAYKWRVQSYSKNKAAAMCVAYIDARDVMERLDEVCGASNWQSDFKAVGDQIFAGIGIAAEVRTAPDLLRVEWVWKWDTGSETKVEAEKGQASDSFKRAAVKWGIGRFLYDMPVVNMKTDGALSESHKYPSVIDDHGNKVWDLTKHVNEVTKIHPSKDGWVVAAPAKPAAKQSVKAAATAEEPATHMQNVQERAKKVVSEIAAIITERAPELKTKEERDAWIKKQTGLSPSVDNNEEILVRLKAI